MLLLLSSTLVRVKAVLRVELGGHRHGLVLVLTHELGRDTVHWLRVEQRQHGGVVGESRGRDDSASRQKLPHNVDVVGPDGQDDGGASSAHV